MTLIPVGVPRTMIARWAPSASRPGVGCRTGLPSASWSTPRTSCATGRRGEGEWARTMSGATSRRSGWAWRTMVVADRRRADGSGARYHPVAVAAMLFVAPDEPVGRHGTGGRLHPMVRRTRSQGSSASRNSSGGSSSCPTSSCTVSPRARSVFDDCVDPWPGHRFDSSLLRHPGYATRGITGVHPTMTPQCSRCACVGPHGVPERVRWSSSS